MNRSDLINRLKEEKSLNRNTAELVVDRFFDSITGTLSKGGRVEIRGFGSFVIKTYKPYTGRNPKSGAKIAVAAKQLPFFKVGKQLKELVNYSN